MSVQFGRWNTDGRPVDRDYLAKAEEMLAPYGPDGGDAYIKDNAGILYRAFHTTQESRKESQPLVTPSGAVLCWDGRLDNRGELVPELSEKVTADSADLAIVTVAYEAWGTKCFAKLIGDWALSLWDPKSRSLILAKDPIGTRHLYYSSDPKQITWSTILDPLVLLAGKTFALEEEYIAGWLSFFPATHLTPYMGIHSVPPSCFVRLEPGRQVTQKYWDFNPSKRIRYRTDGEYEEHFRQVFRESVRRRLRSDSPVLAELSGGVDSSSVVCIADTVLASGGAETPRLDTISYYNDSEPNWNERPYFTKVEEKRGRPGCHIDVSLHSDLLLDRTQSHLAITPASRVSRMDGARQVLGCCNSQGCCVLLSGIGGDEVLGGVPTPTPELADHFARVELRLLARQMVSWALTSRKPLAHLCAETMRDFLPGPFAWTDKTRRHAEWLQSGFVRRYRAALAGYEKRLKFLGPPPSFQENLSTLEVLRRQLACSTLACHPLFEKSYPYLDRDLLEFVFAVPREQLVRPRQRRSLMRRALAGIVPEELLNRKRKAFIVRGPMAAISRQWPSLEELTRHMVTACLGIVDQETFARALKKMRNGQEVRVVPILRTFGIELWLRSLVGSNLLHLPRLAHDSRGRRDYAEESLATKEAAT